MSLNGCCSGRGYRGQNLGPWDPWQGFRGCYLDNHRNNWRCARAVRALCENAPLCPTLYLTLQKELGQCGIMHNADCCAHLSARSAVAGLFTPLGCSRACGGGRCHAAIHRHAHPSHWLNGGHGNDTTGQNLHCGHMYPPPLYKLPPLTIPPPPGDRHFHVFLVKMYCAGLCCPSALCVALHCFPITSIMHLCVFCDILSPKALYDVLCCYFRPKMFSPGDHVRYHNTPHACHAN